MIKWQHEFMGKGYPCLSTPQDAQENRLRTQLFIITVKGKGTGKAGVGSGGEIGSQAQEPKSQPKCFE